MKNTTLALLGLLALHLPISAADPVDLVKRQCRSIHLGYQAPPAKAACLEVTAEKSSPGTYFCALGFQMGYFGIQELADGKKIAIFSVWEKGDNKVELIEKGEGVLDKRFGGEGTGGQSRIEFPWEIGKPVKFLVQAKPEGTLTSFTGRVFDPATGKWRLLATFRTESGGIPLKGLYSFVEDFKRDYESAKVIRRASYANGWLLDLDGKWQPLNRAKFTGDVTPSTNIDSGVVAKGFFLQTGGETVNQNTRLNQSAEYKDGEASRPAGIEELLGL